MEHPYSSIVTRVADHACTSCRSRKRKCDKQLPNCSLCTKKSVSCSYNNGSASPHTPPPPYGPISSTNHVSNFPAVFFLDANMFQKAQLEIPPIDVPIPKYIFELIGDLSNWRTIALEFFETIHKWYPIISKARLFGHLLNPLVPRRTDVALLILCMRLTTLWPVEGVPIATTAEYLAAKRLHADLETSGAFSMQVLQAGVLIALYEYGHAIYPAAYLSIGACARYGISSGMDGFGISQLKPAFNCSESEERKRVWWGVLILDRCVNLGNPSRALATPEPHPSSILPIEDEIWDSGSTTPGDIFTLSSPTTLRMGRFARFAQAIYLLGRVYEHVSDRIIDKEFLQEEAVQLRRTIQSLVTLTEVEGNQSNKLEFCTQTAVSHSGLLRLRSSFTCLPMDQFGNDVLNSAQEIEDTVASKSACISSIFRYADPPIGKEMVSPFILDLFYNSRLIFGERIRQTGSKSAEKAAADIEIIMAGLNGRWRASGAYLEIVKASEESFYG